MKTIIRSFLPATIIFVLWSCSSGKMAENAVITPLGEERSIPEGSIAYGLPRTVMTVTFDVERTIEVPGPYSRYAGDLLGLEDVVLREGETWSIEGITVSSHDEPDPSAMYIIGSSTAFRSNALVLKKEGLILDLNPGYFAAGSREGAGPTAGNGLNGFSDMGADEYYRTVNDTAYRRLSIDTTFVRIPYVVERRKRLTTDQLAEKAAKRLMELRDGKHLILTGEANVYPQSEAAINEINRLEKNYTELFTGKIIRQRIKYSCEIIPDRKMSGNPPVLLWFSELTGPSAKQATGSVPVKVDFTPDPGAKEVTMVKPQTEAKDTPVYDKLYYRVPVVTNMKITVGQDILATSRKLIWQFGNALQLPANYIIGK